MSPLHLTALQALRGAELPLTVSEQAEITAAISPLGRDDEAIAKVLSRGRTRVVSRNITERGVRTLPVAPRHRHALLQVFVDAAAATPAWLLPTLTGMNVPQADQVALADDLSSALRWLRNPDGLDVGSSAARNMLDLIAIAVADAAPACAAAKAWATEPAPVTAREVTVLLNTLEA